MICMSLKDISREENRSSDISMTRMDRKRHRNVEEESSEFMPLSKRINNLHINGLSYGLQKSMMESPMESMETDWESGHFISSSSSSDVSRNSPDNCGSNHGNFTNDYRPDLNATENPFYYESNKLLFSLYMERMQRSQICMDKCTDYSFCSTYKTSP